MRTLFTFFVAANLFLVIFAEWGPLWRLVFLTAAGLSFVMALYYHIDE